jgi:protein-S-isoprenylcysteine O-methyltransferase Ste14
LDEKSGLDIFLEYMPALKIRYKVLLTALFQFVFFIALMLGFWWITSKNLFFSGIYHLIISILMIIPFAYITINAEKVRNKYRNKFGKLAYQRLFYRYIIYQNVFGNTSRYCRILLKTDYLLPAFITFPSHFLTNTLFPIYLALPLGLLLLIFGLLLWNPSKEFNVDLHMYVYLIFPEDSRIVESEIYSIIRHPKYLAECLFAIGIGFLANNLIALFFSFFHVIPMLSLIVIEDRELKRRLGEKFLRYKEKVPALIPHYGTWKKFVKLLIVNKISKNEKESG